MNTPYTIAVTYHAKPGRRENFLRQLSAEGVIDTIRAERGCLRYDYYLSVQDADELLLVEQWATRADQQVHMARATCRRFCASRRRTSSPPTSARSRCKGRGHAV